MVSVSSTTVNVELASSSSKNQVVGNWHLVQAQGLFVPNPPVMTFTKNTVHFTYCNTKSGNYKQKGSSISFSNFVSTMMYCRGQEPDEWMVDQALQNCKQVKFTNSGWECYTKQNKRTPVLVFTA